MKKFLIAILLLIPLIIVFTLSTSARIVSAQIEIGVERMVLTHQGSEVEYVVINSEEYVETNKKYTLFVSFTPTFASNKEVEWSSSNPKVAKVKKQGSGAAVTFVKNGYGSVEIIATAVSNTSVSASCIFYVTGKQLGRIDIYGYDNPDSEIEHLDVAVGEKKQVGAKILPADSLGDAIIEWTSENDSVVSVDENGVLFGKKKGSAVVTATVKKDDVTVNASVDITVGDEGRYVTDTVYTEDGVVSLSSFKSPSATIVNVDGGKVESDSISLDGEEAWVTLLSNGKKDLVYLKRIGDNALVIDNYAAYKKGMWQYDNYVAMGSANVHLRAIAANGDNADVRWSSSNESVAKVIDNRIVGISHGKATLTASADGYQSVSVEVYVLEKLGDINLALRDIDDVAGLAERRVFGIYTCNADLSVTNKLKMTIATTYPTQLKDYADFYDHLTFVSEDPSLATVDKNGFVSFNRAAIGKSVKITVKGKFTDNSASASYVFDVVDGINIGYGIKTYYDKTVSAELPDFTPFFEYRYVMEDYLGDYDEHNTLGAVVFQSNVYLPNPEVMDWEDVDLNRPIEGNGYIIDGQLHGTEFDSRIFANGLRAERLRGMCGDDYDLVVNNLYIQSYAPISDDSQEAFNDLKINGGVPYRLDTANEELADLTVTFRYCMFRYAYMHVNPASGHMVLDGCIFSNSAGPGVTQYGGTGDSTDLVIRNCIFSNTIAPVYLATRGNLELEKTDDDLYKYTILHLEGENYVYNWKLIDEVQMNIFPSTNNEYLNGMLAGLNEKISEYLKEVLEQPSNKKFIYKHPKGDYLNFGFLTLSIWAEENLYFNPNDPTLEIGERCSAAYFDEKKWLYGRLDFSVVEEIILERERGIFASLYKQAKSKMGIDLVERRTYLMIPQENGEYNTQPGEIYHIDEKTKARLRGEGK